MKKKLLRGLSLALTLIITITSMNIEAFANIKANQTESEIVTEISDNDKDINKKIEPFEELDFHYDGLMSFEGTEVDYIAPSEIAYDLDEIGDQIKQIRENYANKKDIKLDLSQAFDAVTCSESYNHEWDRYSSNYVYNKLEDNKKLVWEALDALCLEALKTTKNYNSSLGFVSSSAFSTIEELANFILMYKYVNPQYYFISNGYTFNRSNGVYRISFKIYDNMCNGIARAETTANFKNGIESFKNNIDFSGNDYDIVKNVSDYICNNVEYNHQAVNTKHVNEQSEYTQSAYSTFTLKNTVCAGYAMATSILLNDAGIDCISVTSPGHAYNKVRVFDSWYNLDTTNMDQVTTICYLYFLKSSASLNSPMHEEDAIWENYKPPCTLDSGSTWTVKPVIPTVLRTADPEITLSELSDSYSVSISCQTPGSSIYYTLDGKSPSSSFTRSMLYKGPFNVKTTQNIKAIAVCDTYLDSNIVTYVEKPVDVTVSYDANGGTCKTLNNIQTTGTYYNNLPIPTKTGYTFEGWYDSITGGNLITQTTQVINRSNHTLYAHWSAISMTVNYDANGGTCDIKSKTVIYDNSYGELPTPFRTSYTFDGWFTQKTGGTQITGDTKVTALESHYLYAHWTGVSTQVVFYPNGGSCNITEKTVYYDDVYGELPVPERKGFLFVGWFFKDEQITASSKVTMDFTHYLQALWEPVPITVTLDPQGGTVDKTSITVYYNENYGELPVPKRKNYGFLGWFTNEYPEVPINASSKVLNSENHTLYAHWEYGTYTVTFDATGGTVSPSNKTVRYNSPYGDLPVPKRPLYDFKGWYKDETLNIPITSETIVSEDEDHKLYAKWSKKYTANTPSADIPNNTAVKRNTEVNLSSNTSGATIYYTTSFDEVETLANHNESNLYTGPITITMPTTIWAIATKENYNDSSIFQVSYTVINEAEYWGDISAEDRTEKNFADASAVPDDLWVAGIPKSVDYTGKAITFDELHIYNHKKLLTANTDYTIKYANNINTGKASIKITGKGNYSGFITEYFTITPLSLDSYKAVAPDITLVGNGRSQYGTTTVMYEIADNQYVTLRKGKDFDYVYTSDCVTGKHTVVIKGKGNYCDNTSFTELIVSNNEQTPVSTLKFGKIDPLYATGSGVKPSIDVFDKNNNLLTEGSEYELEYINNIYPGTATLIVKGIGHYSGTKLLTFKINALAINKATVTSMDKLKYTGRAIRPDIRLNYMNEPLTKGIDYIIEKYDKNTDAGKNKAAAYIKGIGRFTGTLKIQFTINPVDIGESCYRNGQNIGSYEIVKGGVKPDISFKINGIKLIRGKDYTVSYTNNKLVNDNNSNKVPTMTVIGKGNYTGTLNLIYNIAPSSIQNCKIDVADIVYSNKTGTCKPKFTVYDSDGSKLVAGKDYSKEYKVCYAEDTVIEKLIDKKLKITKSDIAKAGQEVDLCNDIIPSGTRIILSVYGKGDYTGNDISSTDTLSAEFRYVDVDLSKATVTVITPQKFISDNVAVIPDKKDLKITVKNGSSVYTLKDYEYEIISCSNNNKKGSATLQIRGLNKYGGTKTIKYNITARNMFNWFGLN